VLVCHRRAGKTVSVINDTINRALLTAKPRARYGYIAPFYSQAKSIAWDYLKHFAKPFAVKVLEASLSVELFNEARISLYGADNPDSFRGLYFDGAVVDEYGDCRPNLWGEILRPALADRQGWGVFIGTPNGMNHFFDIQRFALAHPDGWYSLILPVTDTAVLPAAEQAEMRQTMSDDEWEQEMMCSFTASVRGSIYGKDLPRAAIGDYPLIPNIPCNYVFDLGYTDTTAVWRWQEAPGGRIRLSLAHEQDNRALAYWIEWLHGQRTTTPIGKVWLPHDARAKSLQTGRSIVEQFLYNGIRPDMVPNLDVLDGIQAARSMMSNYDIDKLGCEQGLLALSAYHREWDGDRKQYRDKPVHDWSSNFADSFRYLSLVARKAKASAPAEKQKLSYKPLYEFSLNDLWDKRHG
jgi:hypothetical protein